MAAAGGYEHLDKMEDYWLFARMIHAGARVGNVAEPLVLYWVGAGAYARAAAAGRCCVRSWRCRRACCGQGLMTPVQFVRNVAVRGVCGFIPTAVRKPIYAAFTRLRSR